MQSEAPLLPYRVGTKAVIIENGQVLLIEYFDQTGRHYNFPGGGIRPDETVTDGLAREIWEETEARARIGKLLMVGNYFPPEHNFLYGREPAVTLYFSAHLHEGSRPQMPTNPDTNQTGVRWFDLQSIPDSLIPAYHPRVIERCLLDSPNNIFTRDP